MGIDYDTFDNVHTGYKAGDGEESCGGVCRTVGVFYYAFFFAADYSAAVGDTVYRTWEGGPL